MDKKILIRSLINGLLTWIIISLIRGIRQDLPVGKALINPYAIAVGVACVIASYIGFIRSGRK